jgi:hypothetical protein
VGNLGNIGLGDFGMRGGLAGGGMASGQQRRDDYYGMPGAETMEQYFRRQLGMKQQQQEPKEKPKPKTIRKALQWETDKWLNGVFER